MHLPGTLAGEDPRDAPPCPQEPPKEPFPLHNLLTGSNPSIPTGTKSFISLGLDYCMTRNTINTTTSTFDRLYLHDMLPDEDDDNNGYIPSLYIHSD